MNLNDLFTEEKVRLDPHCWHNKKIGNPKTKVKGGTRVNNCVPAESVEEAQTDYQRRRQRERDVDAGKPVKPPPKNPQNDYFARRKKERDMAEGVMYGAENLHVGDDVIISGDVNLKGATGVIDSFGQDNRFVVVNLYNHGKHSFHSSDVSANDHDNDEHDDLDETRRGQVPMTLKPGETDNLAPEDIPGFRKLPAYKQGQQAQQQAGQTPIQKSPYTFQSDQDFAYHQGAFDTQQAATSAQFAKLNPVTAEGEQQKGADYRDPPEDKDPDQYGDDYQAMVARVKKLAGLGPMKTVYDPTKRVYKNVPTADQPKK